MIRFETWHGSKAERIRLKSLYHQSFPIEERVPFWILAMKTKHAENNWLFVYDDMEFLGIVYTVCYMDIVYIWYFALLPNKQGQGYGSVILQMLHKQYHDKRVILNIEIDDPQSKNNELRHRRKQFYLRNGYVECGFYTKEVGVLFEMLSYGGTIEYAEYQALLTKYFNKVLCALFLKKKEKL